jgi:hypothetical protein
MNFVTGSYNNTFSFIFTPGVFQDTKIKQLANSMILKERTIFGAGSYTERRIEIFNDISKSNFQIKFDSWSL